MAKTLRLADRAAFLITGNGIQSLASMATVMVLTRLLTATQWGSYKQMWLAYNAAAPFLLLGIPASVLFFVPRLEAKDRPLFTTQSALLLAAIGTLAAFGLWAAAPTLAHNWHNPGALPLLRAFAPYPVFAFPLSQVANSLVAQNRHRTAALLTALFALTLAAAVVTTAAATRNRPAAAGLVPVAWAIVVASAIQLAMEMGCPVVSMNDSGGARLQEGMDTLALVGHSFGGSVVIQAAALDDHVRTVVALATQSYGTAPVEQLGPRCSVLLLHGTADGTVPPSDSEHVYRLAREPKQLILCEGAGHGLDETAEEVHQVVHDWIVDQLSKAA